MGLLSVLQSKPASIGHQRTQPVLTRHLLGLFPSMPVPAADILIAAAAVRTFKYCPHGEPAKMRPYLSRRVLETQYSVQVRGV